MSIRQSKEPQLKIASVECNAISTLGHLRSVIVDLIYPRIATTISLPASASGDSCEVILDLAPSVLPSFFGELGTSQFLQRQSLASMDIVSLVDLSSIDITLLFGVPLIGTPSSGSSGAMQSTMLVITKQLSGTLLRNGAGLLVRTSEKNPVTSVHDFYLVVPDSSLGSFVLKQIAGREQTILLDGNRQSYVNEKGGKAELAFYKDYIEDAIEGLGDKCEINPNFMDCCNAIPRESDAEGDIVEYKHGECDVGIDSSSDSIASNTSADYEDYNNSSSNKNNVNINNDDIDSESSDTTKDYEEEKEENGYGGVARHRDDKLDFEFEMKTPLPNTLEVVPEVAEEDDDDEEEEEEKKINNTKQSKPLGNSPRVEILEVVVEAVDEDDDDAVVVEVVGKDDDSSSSKGNNDLCQFDYGSDTDSQG